MNAQKAKLKKIIREALADDYVTSSRYGGNVDDFRAPAGTVGSSLARKIGMSAMLTGRISGVLEDLRKNGYDKEEVREVLNDLLEQTFSA